MKESPAVWPAQPLPAGLTQGSATSREPSPQSVVSPLASKLTSTGAIVKSTQTRTRVGRGRIGGVRCRC